MPQDSSQRPRAKRTRTARSTPEPSGAALSAGTQAKSTGSAVPRPRGPRKTAAPSAQPAKRQARKRAARATKADPEPPLRRVGRKLKLNQDRIARLTTNLQVGSYIEPACRHAGISVATFYIWMRHGEDVRDQLEQRRELGEPDPRPNADEAPFLQFLEAMESAMAHAEIRATTQIALAGAEEWRAAAHLLERRHPERWGRKDRTEMSGDLTVKVVSPDELAKKIDEAVEAREKAKTADPAATL